MDRKFMFLLLAILSMLTTIYIINRPFIKSSTTTFSKQIQTKIDTIKTGKACPKGIILYTVDGGNTGNKVWEYISVLAVCRLFPEKRFIPFIPDSILKSLGEIFEPLSLPPMSKLPVKCRNFKGEKIISNSDRCPVIINLPNDTKAVQISKYSSRYEDVILYGLDKVRQELRYKPATIKIAMDTFYDLRKQFSIPSNVSPVYVGMHFRGTDYTPYLKKRFQNNFMGPPTHEFYSKAMKYFTDKYEHVIFVLISVDYKWVQENIKQLKGNVAVNPYKNSKVQDMALLSHCNHSIISYGTFGVTVAMLAGGTTVVYDSKLQTLATSYAKLTDNWILLH